MSATTIGRQAGPRPRTRAEALVAALKQLGFAAGVPAHLSDFARRVDAGLVGALRCPHCKRRLRYCPFRLGTLYRVIAECIQCGHGEEF